MDDFDLRNRVFLALGLAMAVLLTLAVFYAAYAEQPFTNSYALQADAFLKGRLWVTDCFDGDCAVYEGRTYVMFPPLPAVIAMPFVALFGTGFSGFVFIGLAFSAASMLVWHRILAHLMRIHSQQAVWLLLAIAFATPLYYVTIRSSGVWFLAQSTAFLFVTLALYLTIARRMLVLAGVMIGLAFLCRQFSVFYLPFLFMLTFSPESPTFRIDRQRIVDALKLGLPVLAAVMTYVAYNYFRFGAIGTTGYEHMMNLNPESVIAQRMGGPGLFALDYWAFNLAYLFIQGFHIDFTGPTALTMEGLDAYGTSLLAASPFVLFALFAPNRRDVWMGVAMIVVMIVPMLFYHSNGYSQYNAQRYTLDWLPILFVILAMTLPRGRFETFPVFVLFGMGLNVVTLGLVALLY